MGVISNIVRTSRDSSFATLEAAIIVSQERLISAQGRRMSRFSDILIIGGGAIGGSIALALAERGASVSVFEAGAIGKGASWAAAGVLAPDWSGEDPPALTRLAADSLLLWPDWVRLVEDRSGIALNFRRDGLINVWVDPEAPHLPPDLATTPPPCPEGRAQRLSAAEVRELEPKISGPILGGVLYPEDAQVDNPRLATALLRAAASLGTRVRSNAPIRELLGAGGKCRGIRLASGETIEAEAVVVAAGAWSGPLAASSGLTLPTIPWRGQMVTLDAAASSRPLSHIVFCGEMVLIPRPHGPLVVGTTLENVGFDSRVTAAGMHHIFSRLERIAPDLGGLPVLKTWAGLRPGTPDHLPYLGPVPGWEGLFAATGHGRKGIILAPITGALMAEVILEGRIDPRILECLPGRLPPRLRASQ